MKYEKQILEAYKALGYNPRGNQVADINQIIFGFLDEGFKTIILQAPTGVGKSIIGAITAEVIHRIKNPDQWAGASFLLTTTNMLAAQYSDTFQKGKDPLDTTFRVMKGANNFNCAALSTPEEEQTAESCSVVMFYKKKMDAVIETFCNSCDFNLQKKLRERTRHLITNYSMHFVDRMYMELLAKRTVCVFDEAHLINDLFTEHNAIYFSESRLKKMAEEINTSLNMAHTDVFRNIKKVREDLMNGLITQSNYMEYLNIIADVYGQVTEHAQDLADRNSRDQKKYITLSKLSKKYFNLGCKIGDLLLYDYPHAFEYKEREPKVKGSEDEVSVKPIFVGDMFDKLINADYNLLMSATMSEQYARRTLTLENAKYIALAPTFPKENKKVVFFKPLALNYTSMKDPKILKQLQANCYQIAKHHIDKRENGIVLAPSFALVQGVSEVFRTMDLDATIYEHRRGEKLPEVLGRFKQNVGKPAILLTPSGFEGLDLPGDLSRWQIMMKCPFGSLGEARMKYILAHFPDIYSLLCLMKVVQSVGRSVRSPDDWAISYMLDAAAQRLWTGKPNVWANECSTSFTSILEN